MGSKSSECRFCLKKMELNDRMAMIDDEISEQFSNITNMQLHFNEGYSQIVCEVCLRSLQLACAIKSQFIENQRKLNSMNVFENESESECSELLLELKPETTQNHKRKADNNECEDFIDPLQLVSVHESYDENGSTSDRLMDIKQEPSEVMNEDQTMLLKKHARPGRPRKNPAKPTLKKLKLTPDTEKPSSITEVGGDGKKFKCPHCDNIYKRSTHMVRHMKITHMKVRYNCVVPGCEHYSVRRERLKKHVEANHADLPGLEFEIILEQIKLLKPIYGTDTSEL